MPHKSQSPSRKIPSQAPASTDWVNTGYLVLPQQRKPSRNAKLPACDYGLADEATLFTTTRVATSNLVPIIANSGIGIKPRLPGTARRHAKELLKAA